MKRCPECRRDYYDESLLYCLDDGNALLDGPASFDQADTVADMRAALPTAWLSPNAMVRARPGGYLRASIIALAAILVAGGAFVYYKVGAKRPINVSFESAKFVRSTSSGRVSISAISPDGKWLVYSNTDGQQQSLWLQQVAVAGSSTRIMPPADVSYFGLAFSPDGNYVYYTAADGGQVRGTLFQVPVLGVAARKLFTGIMGKASFSPDGKRITYYDYVGEKDVLMVANADGSEQRQLAERGEKEFFCNGTASPAWSPDGKIIATTIGTLEPMRMSVATISPETGEITTFSREFKWVGEVTWLADGSSVLVLAAETVGETEKIWQIPYPSGEPKKISNELNLYSTISLTADSNTLASVRVDRSGNIWSAPLVDTSRITQVTFGSDDSFSPSWTPDGKMVFARRSGDVADIYIVDPSGGVPKQLTANSGVNADPVVSADGRIIAFTSDRTGQSSLWKMNLDGSDQTQLTNTDAGYPSFSPDGREVIFSSITDSVWSVWKVSIDGGAPVRLTERTSTWPRFSPNGKQFVCFSEDPKDPESPIKITIYPSDGGPALKSLPKPKGVSPGGLRWMPDGRSIVYNINKDGVSNLWTQSVDGGPLKQITKFTSDLIFSVDLSADGRIALSRGPKKSDVVLISGFKK